jgi:PmbA protein
MMDDRTLLEQARAAVALARKAGAQDARAVASSSREVVLEWRDGRLDRVRESTKQSLGVSLYVDGRFVGSRTSDLTPASLEAFVARNVAAARFLAKDPHRRLPDPARYQGPDAGNLELFDASVGSSSTESRAAVAQALEQAARSQPGADAIASVECWVMETEGASALCASNGREVSRRRSMHSRGLEVSVRDQGDRKPSDGSWCDARFASDLRDPAQLGPEATRRALAQRGAGPLATGKYTILIENRTAERLLNHLLNPMSGGALQQKRSFLLGLTGQEVASPLLTLRDDPLRRRGLASATWDDEGMALKPLALIERGVLKNFYLDTYYASKLGLEPTTGYPTNLAWDLGARGLEAMRAELAEGLLVTGFVGGNSNGATGDFSLGITGFHVKDGKIAQPVSEMNLSGNHLTFWKQLKEVGSDPWDWSSTSCPSLRFDDVTCSGS